MKMIIAEREGESLTAAAITALDHFTPCPGGPKVRRSVARENPSTFSRGKQKRRSKDRHDTQGEVFN